MESLLSIFPMHWDHEPFRTPGQGTRPTSCRPSALTGRFMEREKSVEAGYPGAMRERTTIGAIGSGRNFSGTPPFPPLPPLPELARLPLTLWLACQQYPAPLSGTEVVTTGKNRDRF